VSLDSKRVHPVLSKAYQVISNHPLCNHCLGRQFRLLNEEQANETRGSSIKDVLFLEFRDSLRNRRAWALRGLRTLARSGYGPASTEFLKATGRELEPKRCYICDDALFNTIENTVSSIILLAREYDFNSFQVGSSLPRKMIRLDDEIKMEYKLSHGESIKTEFNRIINNAVSKLTGKTHSFHDPDLMIMAEPVSGRVVIGPAPVYIYGRYRKLQGGISQTRKRGADAAESIEGMLASILIKIFCAKDIKFHGAGREDVDAKMLGSGRPFIVEILEPKLRNTDLMKFTAQFNEKYSGMVEIFDLEPSSKAKVVELKLKGERTSKLYRITVKVPRIPSREELEETERKTKGLVISQRTPKRVSWRRADKVRKRMIAWIKIVPLPPERLDVTIEAQAGTYIKEFVTGDDGRTSPSLRELLNMPAEWESLEVLNILGD